MPFFHDFASENNLPINKLGTSELFSIFYHDIFEYPLTFSELLKWTPNKPPKININVGYKNGYYFVKGNEGLIYKRALRNRMSLLKMQIAQKAARILSFIPSIRMVGITGSLAMENSAKNSDIDFIVITQKGRLWTTRIIAYLLLNICGLHLRKPRDTKQKDRLCLNIWLDESDLSWPKNQRNIYTAHEILQIKPLVNNKHTYEHLLEKNHWVSNYWSNYYKGKLPKNNYSPTKLSKLGLLNYLAYHLQLFYMKNKISREVVKPTRAIFHPVNLSDKILKNMGLDRGGRSS
jgi:hypothetical protein